MLVTAGKTEGQPTGATVLRQVEWEGERVPLRLWDTAGQEDYEAVG